MFDIDRLRQIANGAARNTRGDGGIIEADYTDIEVATPPVITEPRWEPAQRVVNNTKFDPYGDIQKTASHTANGNLTGYAVEMEDKDGSMELVGTVGAGYLLVPNSEVRMIAHEITEASPWSFKEDMVVFDGKTFTLTLDIEDEDLFQNTKPNADLVADRDPLGFGLMFRNSYNGTRSFEAMIYLKRMVCKNGMISRRNLAHYKFRHSLSNEGWQDELRAALQMLSGAPEKLSQFIEGIQELQQVEVTQRLLTGLRSKRGACRNIADGTWGKVMDRWARKEEPTAYGLLNACTNILWHNPRLNQTHIKQNDEVVTGMLNLNESL